MTRWRANSKIADLDIALVFQVVAEMHIVGRPTQMVVGDAFTLMLADKPADAGVIIGVPKGHVVVRMAGGRMLHLRPRRGTDPESGYPPPRGKISSEWVVERLS